MSRERLITLPVEINCEPHEIHVRPSAVDAVIPDANKRCRIVMRSGHPQRIELPAAEVAARIHYPEAQ